MTARRFMMAVLFAGLAASCSKAPSPETAPEKAVFPIGGFSPSPARDREAGFTLAGPVYSRAREKLAECEAAGLPFYYPVGVDLDFTAKKEGKPPESLDAEAIREEIRAQVLEVAGSGSIVAWYLQPEELRFWMPLEMEYLRIASETIREADPQKRPVWMYEPNHRTAGALEKTLPHVQIAGKGLYANYVGRKAERAWITWSLGEQQAARAAVNPAATPIAVLEMFQEPEEKSLVASWVRHDCYAALLGGARAIVVYSFAKRKNFPARDLYYESYAEIARELNGEKNLGSVFLLGKETPVPVVKILDGPKTVTLRASKSAPKEPLEVPALQVKGYDYGGRRHVFLLNSTPGPLTVQVGDEAGWTSLWDGSELTNPGPGPLVKLGPWGVAGLWKEL